jgi:hypothetical protein
MLPLPMWCRVGPGGDFAWRADGDAIAVDAGGGLVQIRDARSAGVVARTQHTRQIERLALAPDSSAVAVVDAHSDAGGVSGDEEALATLRFRNGSDALASELIPFEAVAAAVHRPGRMADFLAGEPPDP